MPDLSDYTFAANYDEQRFIITDKQHIDDDNVNKENDAELNKILKKKGFGNIENAIFEYKGHMEDGIELLNDLGLDMDEELLEHYENNLQADDEEDFYDDEDEKE
jgi:hypothetical protein